MVRPNLPPMDVCERLTRLEVSLRRTRLALIATLCGLLVIAAAGWRPENTVEAEKLLLTDANGSPVLVLRGIMEATPALILETPSGAEVLRLGPSVRFVR